MPVRTIILRVEEEEFKKYEALKKEKDSWESMFRREVLDTNWRVLAIQERGRCILMREECTHSYDFVEMPEKAKEIAEQELKMFGVGKK